jgi:hypothetical protein
MVWEGNGNMNGTYRMTFNGQADLSVQFNYGTFSNKVYNAATNTTTADMVVTDTGAQNFNITFSNTRRTSTNATNTGVTNVRLMRPTFVGSSTSFAESTLFTPYMKNACSQL